MFKTITVIAVAALVILPFRVEAAGYVITPVAQTGDTIGGEVLVLQADAESGSVRVVEAPAGAMVIHTFWFAWAAFYPETEMYEESHEP